MKIKIVNSLTCPKCGNGETHPTLTVTEGPCKGMPLSLIRAFKVLMTEERGWESQCLVCSGYYNKQLWPTPGNHNPEMGWFSESEMKD